MKAGLQQSTQLKQELKINPRLYQAMDLLYMPLLDLQQHLKQELLNNPFLEMVDLEEEEEDEEENSEVEAPEEVSSQRVRAHFIPVGQSSIELLEGTASDSAITKYIEKRGPGIHHITLRVDDIRAALARLKARGVRLVDEEPRQGAEGALVAFINPSAAHGVLVELKQT